MAKEVGAQTISERAEFIQAQSDGLTGSEKLAALAAALNGGSSSAGPDAPPAVEPAATGEPDAAAATATPEPKPGEIHPLLKEMIEREKPATRLPTDPAGTFRDELNRLRREDNYALVPDSEITPVPGQITTENEDPAKPPKPNAAGELKPIKLPGRNPEQPFEFQPRNQEEYERIQHLARGFKRNEQIAEERARVQETADELESRIRYLQADPVSFVQEQLDAADQAGVAQRLLASLPPDQFKAVMEQAKAWEQDSLARENVQLTTKNERHEKQKEFDQQEASRKALKERTNKVIGEVMKLIPDDMTDQQADKFYRVSLTDLEAWVLANKAQGRRLEPALVAQILQESGTLELFGVSIDEPAPPVTPKKGAAPKPAPPAQVQAAKEAGPKFRQRTEARKAATALTPPGAGAAPAQRVSPPAGQTVKERSAWAKNFFKK